MAYSFEDPADNAAVLEFYNTRGGVRGLVESGETSIPPQFVSPISPAASSANTTFSPPTVDLALPRADAVALIRAAASSAGIFHVVHHGVPSQAVDAALAGVAAFNELPFAARSPHYSPGIPIGAVTYATVCIPRPPGVTAATATTPLLCWRDTLLVRFDSDRDSREHRSIPAACRGALLEYRRSLARLGWEIAGLLMEGLGVDAERLGGIRGSLMQCHYHPQCPEPDRVMGSREHTDADLFTVLAQDGLGGLQVLLDGDKEWLDVAPVPGALLVNVGDLLQVLSNDEYKSVEHRVVIKSTQEPRVSIALFFNAAKHGKSDFFAPFPELVTEEKPAQYRPLTWQQVLDNREELGHAKPSSLDEFRVTKSKRI